MKKIFCLIIAFGIFITSGIFAETARAEEIINESEEGAIFSCEPSITIDPRTGNLGVDIYVFHANKVGFTNFEAKIPFKGDMGKVAGVTVNEGAEGNANANIVKGNGVNYLNIIFNASKPVVSEGMKVRGFGGSPDGNTYYTLYYVQKVMSIKTDKKAETEITDGVFSVKNLKILSLTADEGTVIEAGYKSSDGKIKAFENKGMCNLFAMIPGDFDLDGEITIKDVIAAQYYYVNGVEAISFGEQEFLIDSATGEKFETPELKKTLIPINSYVTQFIISYIAGNTGYGEVMLYISEFSRLATMKGGVSEL